MTDIDKLIAHFEAVKELNGLKGDFDENDNYQHIRVTLPPNTKITLFKYNDGSVVTEMRCFPFSGIEDETILLKKKIAYRKEKLSVKNIVEKNTGEK